MIEHRPECDFIDLERDVVQTVLACEDGNLMVKFICSNKLNEVVVRVWQLDERAASEAKHSKEFGESPDICGAELQVAASNVDRPRILSVLHPAGIDVLLREQYFDGMSGR